jgi:hypothetical protein
MTALQQSQADRLANLELLISETGFEAELKARRRADIDKQRLALSVALAALPNPERELAALSKEAARTRAAFEAARTAFQDSERQMMETMIRSNVTTSARAEDKQRILTDLERKAPFEVSDALDDLSLADELLRCAFRVDEVGDRNWLGQRIKKTISNVDDITVARDKINEAQRAILDLRHDGRMSSDEMVSRCKKIVDTALEPAFEFEFIQKSKWELRRSRSLSDFVKETSGYEPATPQASSQRIIRNLN